LQDALTAEFDYSYFEGGNDFPALPKQEDGSVGVGYISDGLKPAVRLYEDLTSTTRPPRRGTSTDTWRA
jgi:hypothetical protein